METFVPATASSAKAMEGASAPPAINPTATAGPIPMSFPAILRGPGGVSDRFAHLRTSVEREGSNATSATPKKSRRDEKEGKRWVRRKENARFIDNPHIARPRVSDMSVPTPQKRPTFPSPLPRYLPRNVAIPAASPTSREPVSASAGQFSMSKKGMRRELRGRGVMTEVLVREVEDEIMAWLDMDVWVDPDTRQQSDDRGDDAPIGSLGVIREVERTHMHLVWEISDDAFARYVVHCCARYHNVVSFSKDGPIDSSPTRRFTHILRPHVTRPNQDPSFHTVQGLYTPPHTDLSTDFDSVGGTDVSGTDIDMESSLDVESDFAFSEVDSDAELEGVPPPLAPDSALVAIIESAHTSPHLVPGTLATESDVEHDADIEHSDLGSEVGEDELANRVASLEITPRPVSKRLGLRRRSRPWDRQRRAPSSPSGSPARRNPTRRVPKVESLVIREGKTSFYDFLFL